MGLKQVIKEIKSLTGLEELRPNKEGVYSLRVNHRHLIYLSESVDQRYFYLYAPLCHIPFEETKKTDLFEALLKANLFGQETGKCWFAIEKISNQVLLLKNLALHNLSHADLINMLTEFISVLEYWKLKMEDISTMHLKTKRKKGELGSLPHHFIKP